MSRFVLGDGAIAHVGVLPVRHLGGGVFEPVSESAPLPACAARSPSEIGADLARHGISFPDEGGAP